MQFASRISRLEDKSMLDAFEIMETEDMISFSAGTPAPDTYPIDHIAEAFDRVLKQEGRQALSYCPTSGYKKLREIIAGRMAEKFKTTYTSDEIIITGGSQQGLDMSGMLFVNKGDVVLFETPSYLGAVNALRAHEAELVAIPTDREGIETEPLKHALDRYGERVKMVYVIPDFQNPTGRSWSDARRRHFMELMSHYDVPVIEDAAYSELSFDKELRKPLAWYDKKGQVIYIGTFSKTFCPGLRVAWLCARKEIMEKYLVLKNASDLSSPSISQRQMAYYLEHYSLDDHISEICAVYKRRCDVMIAALREHFPTQVTYEAPRGGLFIWATLPEGKDARELLLRAAEHKVAFMPGSSFYPSAAKNNEFRLNFSNVSEENVKKGIAILGGVINTYLQES